MTPTDAELVRRARDGDRDAFAALVGRHHATLLRCCRRLAGPDLALDAAQDAVVTALLSLDRLRRPESFGAWLVGIGLNAARVALRGSDPLTPVCRGIGPTTDQGGSDPLTQGGSDPLSCRGGAEASQLRGA